MEDLNLNSPRQVCWLCYSNLDVTGILSVEFHAVFEHRVSALLFAYCICDEIEYPDPSEFELKIEIKTEDLNLKQYPWHVPKIGNRSIHFKGSYDYYGVKLSVQVAPVLMGDDEDEEDGSHVVVTNLSFFGDMRLRIERIRRVNTLDSENYPNKIYREGSGSVKGRYGCRYISTLISCPKHLLESDNSERNIDTKYLSAIESLYPLDIVNKLGDIISVIFPRTGLHQSYLPLYCVDRIVSFFSIEDVSRLLHYGLPSKNDFDSRRLKEDIFYSLPKTLISVPFEKVFRRAESKLSNPDDFDTMLHTMKDESPLSECSSEEFWILFNESLKNPHSYLKNEIKVNGIFRPLFVIPIEYQKGYIRNSILRIRSFLLKKNALHLVENEAIKIQTISRIVNGSRVSFCTTLIQAIFTVHGSRSAWWYSALDKQSCKLKRLLDNVDWDGTALYIRYPCRRQIIMLTEEAMGEDISEPPCEISRVEKCLPCTKTLNSQNISQGSTEPECDILQDGADELRFDQLGGFDLYWIKDAYRERLINYLTDNFERIYRSYVTRANFSPLPELWKLLADTFGISNYSVIKSEDEITPTAVQNDLVVISFRGDEYSIARRLRHASAHCFRNYKSSISCSIASADDDETPCVQLNVLQLLWDENLRLSMGKAKMDISRSGRLLHLCGLRGWSLDDVKLGPFQFTACSGRKEEYTYLAYKHLAEIFPLLIPLKFRPVQVWFGRTSGRPL